MFALDYACELVNEHNSLEYALPDQENELKEWSSMSGPKHQARQVMMEFGFTKRDIIQHIEQDIHERTMLRPRYGKPRPENYETTDNRTKKRGGRGKTKSKNKKKKK
jgi:hypothetical protein